MGTWIEIWKTRRCNALRCVVPCNGNVDWNGFEGRWIMCRHCRSLQWERGLKCYGRPIICIDTVVVPCNGNVDWNILAGKTMGALKKVVPCNGNVDWNTAIGQKKKGEKLSFPAMGTWIEILLPFCKYVPNGVVPCNGNVDWNFAAAYLSRIHASFPAMGTWIEMFYNLDNRFILPSFPAMGTWIEIPSSRCPLLLSWGRSLQWERGLKFDIILRFLLVLRRSFPAMGTWIEIILLRSPARFHIVVPCNGNVDWNLNGIPGL